MGVNVALIDDHQMVSQGLAGLLSSKLPELNVSAYCDPVMFLQTLDNGGCFALVVTDMVMMKMNGLAFASAIRDRAPNLPVLLISGVEDEVPMEALLSSGAVGFVSKKAGHERLCEGIKSALEGKYFICDQALDRSEILIRTKDGGEELGGEGAYKYPTLSHRQIEILQLIAAGESNRAISTSLSISENTVKSHIKLIFEALRVNKRAACVRQAKLYGFI